MEQQTEKPQSKATQKAVDSLWVDLGRKSSKIRMKAEHALFDLGEEGIELLLNKLRSERRERIRLLISWLAGTIVLCLCFFLLSIWIPHFPFNAIVGPIFSSIFAAITAQKRARSNAARILAGFDDLRTVGLLAEALHFKEDRVRYAARETLMRLLPQLKANDAHLLNERQRECLYRVLGGYDGDLILKVLKALEQIGDEKALPYVQKLANGGGIATADSRVEEAAVACLPFLQARVEQQRLSQTLLRGSSIQQATPEVLLRPAQGIVNAQPDQLLRATNAQE